MDNLDYFTDLIISKNLDLQTYSQLYESNNLEKLFITAINDDFLELVQYLYCEKGCKFYINDYIEKMDRDLYEVLNDDIKGDRCYKIIYKNQMSESFNYLISMKKYSKCKKDCKGFYYIINVELYTKNIHLYH